MSHLSEEEIVYLRELFNLFDEDGNGVITVNEVIPIMDMLGDIPNEDVLFSDYDIDGSGFIDFAEFLMTVSKRIKNLIPIEELNEAFTVFDKNGSGQVNFSELKHVLMNMGEKLSETEVDEMIREADTDGDGSISFDEFLAMFNSKQ
jgi:calmodulin